MSCGVCQVKVSRDSEKVNCGQCDNIFHLPCGGLNIQDLAWLRNEKKIWSCTKCAQKAKTNRSNDQCPASPYVQRSATTVSSPTVPMVDNIMLQKVYDELIQLKQSTIVNHNTTASKIDSLEKALDKINELFNENINLKDQMNQMQVRLDTLEQQNLQNAIDVIGTEAFKNENVYDSVIKIVNTGLNLNLRESDIDFAYRKRKKNGDLSTVLSVKFVRHHTRNLILEATRKTKHLSTDKCGLNGKNKIFINETLTFAKRQLFIAAKNVKIEKGYKYLWIRNAKILLRKNEGDNTIVINCLNDLNML